MKKKDWIIVILVLSLFGNVALLINNKRATNRENLKYELLMLIFNGTWLNLKPLYSINKIIIGRMKLLLHRNWMMPSIQLSYTVEWKEIRIRKISL